MSEEPGAPPAGAESARARGEHSQNFEASEVTGRVARLFELIQPGGNSFEIAAALGTTPAHVRMWRTGARPLPLWVRELAAARATAINDLLKEIPCGPGKPAGYKNLIRNLPGYLANRDKR